MVQSRFAIVDLLLSDIGGNTLSEQIHTEKCAVCAKQRNVIGAGMVMRIDWVLKKNRSKDGEVYY